MSKNVNFPSDAFEEWFVKHGQFLCIEQHTPEEYHRVLGKVFNAGWTLGRSNLLIDQITEK